ncbi:hypothetical protein PoB_004627200 [Plakobranchus ocellatus]|uniref:Zinc finger PHD-type domain-containing protein n=1 Tax=Plakobranchus ocellatus TaxID=259542 RepID=A0AAV4BK48_9GAST|nr:hypothetical protein PoB_004627200 [Plakobranchus ocellatus]
MPAPDEVGKSILINLKDMADLNLYMAQLAGALSDHVVTFEVVGFIATQLLQACDSDTSNRGAEEIIAEPAVTEAAEPAVTKAAEPAVTQAAEPAVTQAAEPAVTEAAEPAVTETAEPAVTEGAEPAVTEAAVSEAAEPAVTEAAEPINATNDSTYACIICSEPFCKSRPGEIRIRCTRCLELSHEECVDTGTSAVFVCDFCQ